MENITLQLFLELKSQISFLEKEVEAIKKDILAKGSFETSMFLVEVKEQTQFRTVDANTLCEVLDPVLVSEKGLIKQITFDKVTVKYKNLLK